MRYTYSLLGILCIFCHAFSYAQVRTDTLVTGNFNNVKVEQFVRELESQTSFHFYYDPRQVDSIQVNVSVEKKPLEEVLELAFANSDIHFSIDQHHNIFLTKSKMIVTQLPEGFFEKRNINDTSISNTARVELNNSNKIVSASLENRLY